LRARITSGVARDGPFAAPELFHVSSLHGMIIVRRFSPQFALSRFIAAFFGGHLDGLPPFLRNARKFFGSNCGKIIKNKMGTINTDVVYTMYFSFDFPPTFE
jgi:hypothetical protein